jgi:hypothetical protein
MDWKFAKLFDLEELETQVIVYKDSDSEDKDVIVVVLHFDGDSSCKLTLGYEGDVTERDKQFDLFDKDKADNIYKTTYNTFYGHDDDSDFPN